MPLGALGWAVVGSAVLGAGTAIYEGQQAQDIANQQLGLEKTVAGEQQQYANMLGQLIQNPGSVATLPGYQFQLSQGSDAVARQMAASGYLGSGTEAEALTQFGQGLASNFYTTQAQLLASLAGITSPSSPSQLGTAATSANVNSSNQLSNLFAQMGLLAGRYGSAGSPPNNQGAGYGGAATGPGE
jgi:hypothetical protein